MCEMQIANDNLLFKEENHFFVFNGHNGELLDVPQSYYDLIRYLKIFNIQWSNWKKQLQILEIIFHLWKSVMKYIRRMTRK